MDIKSSIDELFEFTPPESTDQEKIDEALEIAARQKESGRWVKESIDVKKSSMGEVVKDFKKSKAPQFKGKPPKKRHEMAVAAKLQADEQKESYSYTDRLMSHVSQQISINAKAENLQLREVQPIDDERLVALETQLLQVKQLFHEATMVSGIGQGGDGQTPGSGEVRLARMDDVSVDNIQDGDSLIWDSATGGFVPGAGGPGGGITGVDRIVAGTGIDLDPVGGIGVVEITVDLALEELRNVNGTPTNGDLLIYNNGDWDVGTLTDTNIAISNPDPINGNSLTQEAANLYFGQTLENHDDRIDALENATTPGTFLGVIDVTDPLNEPDTATLNKGDYYIHDGPNGTLWGSTEPDAETVDDGNQVIWDGTAWKIVNTVSTLAQLGDTDTDSAGTGDFLVYDDGTGIWSSQTVDIPNVTVGAVQPNTGQEKDGDFWYDNANGILYIYDSVWVVAGSDNAGANVQISALPPDTPAPEEGDLWVSDDNWALYIFDGNNWVALTNNGLVSGGGDGTGFVTTVELNATVDTLNFNTTEVQNNLNAAVLALDATHLRMTPQAQLAGPLLLSDDNITAAKQATTKEFVEAQDNLHLKLDAANDVTTNFRIKNDGKNLISTGEAGKLHLYHVADPSDPEHGANQKYVDEETAKRVSKTGSTMTGELKINVPSGSVAIRLQEGGTNKLRLTNFSGESRLIIEPNTVFKLITNVNGSDKQSLKVYEDGELRIFNLKSPSDGKDAANRDYVDTTVATSLTDYATETYVDEAVAAIPAPTGGVPVGSIMIWMNSAAPAGWFKLQGSTFNINTYPQLHAYLQSTANYISGTLPDWSGYFPGEWGSTNGTGSLGTKQGYRTAEPTGGNLRSTSNSIPTGATRTFAATGNTNAYSAGQGPVEIRSDEWDDVTRPNTILVHYIIKHD